MKNLRQKIRWILAAVTFAIAVQSAQAGGTLYTIREDIDHLIKIDLDTLAFTDIGPLNTTFAFGGLTWDSNTNTMYCVDGRGNRSLYTIDLNTGNATPVGTHGITDLFGIAMDTSTSTLYGVQFANPYSLYRLDTSNGAPTLIGNCPVRMGGLCYNNDTDQLIASNDGEGDLYEVDRSNGNATLLYNGPYVNDSGLAYDPERNYLWGIDWSGNFFYYDIANGYARTDVMSGLSAHDGLAWVGEVGGYRLSVTGQCPGTVRVAWSGAANDNRQQGLVFGDRLGSYFIPQNQPCGGTELGISGGIRLIRTLRTGNGSGSTTGNAGTAACGHYLQLVEGGSCNVSNPARIP